MIPLLAFRYAFSSTAHHRSSSIRIVLTTAFSLSLLVIIISSMNYLQSSRFNHIRDTRSFDLVVDGSHKEDLKSIYPNATIFEYGEGEALVKDSAFLVRYIGDDYDGGLRFLTGNASSLAVPYSLYSTDRVYSYKLSIMKKGKSGVVLPSTIDKSVSGVFATSMGSEFDPFYIFMPLEDAPENVDVKTAIKNINIKEEKNLEDKGYLVTSWKEAEASLYSAFLIEKMLMYVILALLFLLIAVSTKQAIRIFYSEKRRERAELEILGLGRTKIDFAFLLSYYIILIIGFASAFVLSFVLMPIIERVALSMMTMDMDLEFPILPFIFFASMMMVLSLIFCLIESRKDGKLDLMEVVNG